MMNKKCIQCLESALPGHLHCLLDTVTEVLRICFLTYEPKYKVYLNNKYFFNFQQYFFLIFDHHILKLSNILSNLILSIKLCNMQKRHSYSHFTNEIGGSSKDNNDVSKVMRLRKWNIEYRSPPLKFLFFVSFFKIHALNLVSFL